MTITNYKLELESLIIIIYYSLIYFLILYSLPFAKSLRVLDYQI